MSISEKLEYFVIFFKNKINNSENKSPWFKCVSYKSLENKFIQ